MYISHKWLKRYLPELDDFTPEQIATALTESLAEVEGHEKVRSALKNLVVGEVINVEKHPENEKLSVCQVNLGGSEATIICGAANVAQGQKVAVCLPGGLVYNPQNGTAFQIAAKKIKGIISQGMICSGKELAINNDHEEILVLENELKPGLDLTEMLQDTVYEIENKSLNHRPDCFSHEGIARELSALLGLKFIENKQEISLVATTKVDFTVENKLDSKLCPRFTALVLSDVVVKPSPLWLQTVLSAVKIRPINNIVDITNYVTFDKGQPMHAYDYDKLANKKLVIRQAHPKEKVKTLDDKIHSLSKDMIVITDGNSIQDIAGIMGGFDTEISNKTKTIVLEAANFNMYAVRKTSRTLAIRTEASTRNEKGLDPNLTEKAIKSAIQLVMDLAHAEVASDLIDVYPNPRSEQLIKLDINLVKRFLGIDLSKQQIIDKLTMLNLKISSDEKINESELIDDNTNKLQQQMLSVTIPTYRMDLNITQDLLEEIARIYGYANIKPTLPTKDLKPAPSNDISQFIRRVNKTITGCGMDEIMTYSFVGEEWYKTIGLNIRDCLAIKNPLSPELSHMRNSLVPSLLLKAQLNSKNYNDFDYFENNRVVEKKLDAEKIHIQPRKLAGIKFTNQNEEILYYDLKANLDNLFAEIGVKPEFKPLPKASNHILQTILHPGRSALIYLQDQELGILGEVNGKTAAAAELHGKTAIFELNLDLLLSLAQLRKKYKPLAVFQSVKRDLSFWFNTNTLYADIIKHINSLEEPLIVNVKLKDVFIPKDKKAKKSITFKITLQSYQETLQEDQISKVIARVVATLNKELQAELRAGK